MQSKKRQNHEWGQQQKLNVRERQRREADDGPGRQNGGRNRDGRPAMSLDLRLDLPPQEIDGHAKYKIDDVVMAEGAENLPLRDAAFIQEKQRHEHHSG